MLYTVVDSADTLEDGAFIPFVFKYSLYAVTYRELCEGDFATSELSTNISDASPYWH